MLRNCKYPERYSPLWSGSQKSSVEARS